MKAVRPSLASRVLRNVMLPLALTWLAGTLVALGVAHSFTQKAFDRSLQDDAYLLASHVRLQDRQLTLALSAREVTTVLFDPVETMVFAVTSADGTLLAGQPGLPVPPVSAGAPQHFDLEYGGKRLRAVSLHRDLPVPFNVVVAETTTVRSLLLQRLLLLSLGPQILLLVLLALWLRRAVRRDMAPLAQLQQALGQRDANDLEPVSVRASSRELEGMAGAVNSLLGRLARSVRAQREFAGNVAHELRTPLAGIRALAEYGLAQKDPAAWRSQLERISDSQARASRLVDQLLDIALAQEAEASLRLGEVALDELVREAVLRFMPRADAAGVDLGALGIDEPTRVTGNLTLIESLLNNLLDNALRYGVDGPINPPTVTVAVARSGGEVLLSVQDNGAGMPGEAQARLIERGAQGETGQLLGQGAGLGLALVAQYAQLMHARFELGCGPGGRGWVCTIAFQTPQQLNGSQARHRPVPA